MTLDSGSATEAEGLLVELGAQQPREWRIRWYRAIAQMAQARPDQAVISFDEVCSAVPGELAPKLALGLASESAGDLSAAARWYEVVARTSPSITSAPFGLARCRLHAGDRVGALAAYERVPETSSGYIDAQTARIRCLSAGDGDHGATLDELVEAGSALEALPLEVHQRERLAADLLDTALRMTVAGKAVDDGQARVLGLPFAERELRLALERSYRELARYAATRDERIALVEDANRVRPRTWI